MTFLKRFTALVLLFVCSLTQADMQSEMDKEADALLRSINPTAMQTITHVSEKLEYAGHTDTKIFDELEKYLLAGYRSGSARREVNSLSWAAKALGFSGNPKYRSTLNEVRKNAHHKKVRKYTKQAQGFPEKYLRWNPIISDGTHYDESLSLSENRYANMLRSDEARLHLLAAKRIFFERPSSLKLRELARSRITNPASNGNRGVTKWLKKAVKNMQ